METQQTNRNKFSNWIKKFGVGAFLFFLIKGMVWIAIFMGVAEFISCS